MRPLLDPYDPLAGGLLGGAAPEPQNPLIDRMSMLPIGQYADGSLTLAWPQMLLDMYEGGVRSFEQGRQLPRVDADGYYAGTPRAEPLDAFNAASAAPMAGVGFKASGLATGPTRDAFLAENLARQFPEEKVITGGTPGNTRDWLAPDRYGDAYLDSSRGLARTNEIPRASRTNGMSWDPSSPAMNDLTGPMTDYDLSALNQIWRDKVVRSGEFFANPETASYPSLLLNSEDGQQNPLLGNEDILRRYGLLSH